METGTDSYCARLHLDTWALSISMLEPCLVLDREMWAVVLPIPGLAPQPPPLPLDHYDGVCSLSRICLPLLVLVPASVLVESLYFPVVQCLISLMVPTYYIVCLCCVHHNRIYGSFPRQRDPNIDPKHYNPFLKRSLKETLNLGNLHIRVYIYICMHISLSLLKTEYKRVVFYLVILWYPI